MCKKELRGERSRSSARERGGLVDSGPGSGSATRSVGGTEGWRGGGRGAANTTPLLQGGRRNPCPCPGGLGHVGGRRLGRNEVPFNLGAQEELLTCHWHLLILKRKTPRAKGPPGGSAGGVAVAPSAHRGFFQGSPGPAHPPDPAHSDCAASASEPMGSSQPPALAANHRRKC